MGTADIAADDTAGHPLSRVPADPHYHDLGPYGFPGLEGGNVAAEGDGARGFVFRRIGLFAGTLDGDTWEFDHPNYGPEGSHWERATARMRKVEAGMRRAQEPEAEVDGDDAGLPSPR